MWKEVGDPTVEGDDFEDFEKIQVSREKCGFQIIIPNFKSLHEKEENKLLKNKEEKM